MMSYLAVSIVLAYVPLVSACEIASTPEPPPLRYHGLSVETEPDGAEGGGEALPAPCRASVVLQADLENTSTESVSRFEATCTVRRTSSAASASQRVRTVRWTNKIAIDPGERRTLCAELGGPAFLPAQTGLQLTRFHLEEVRFADGSRWNDPLGVYAWSRTPDPEPTETEPSAPTAQAPQTEPSAPKGGEK